MTPYEEACAAVTCGTPVSHRMAILQGQHLMHSITQACDGNSERCKVQLYFAAAVAVTLWEQRVMPDDLYKC